MALCRHCALPRMNCSCDDDSGFSPTLEQVQARRRRELLESLLRRVPEDASIEARGIAEIFNDGVRAAFAAIFPTTPAPVMFENGKPVNLTKAMESSNE
jgi:hypothetical protein